MIRIILSLFLTLMISSFNTNAQPVENFNLSVGDTYQMVSVMDQTIVQSYMGTEQELKTKITSTEIYEVTEVTEEGYLFRSQIQKLRTEAVGPFGGDTLQSDGDGPGDQSLKVITGRSYGFNISKNGEILAITGLDEIRETITNELIGTELEQGTTQIISSYTEETLTATLSGIFNIYPENSAENWTKTREITLSGVPTSLTVEYTRENDSTISFSSDITVQGEIEQMNMNMSGYQKGSITVDPVTGMIITSESSGDVAGFITAEAMNNLEIPISVTTVTSNTVTKQ